MGNKVMSVGSLDRLTGEMDLYSFPSETNTYLKCKPAKRTVLEKKRVTWRDIKTF